MDYHLGTVVTSLPPAQTVAAKAKETEMKLVKHLLETKGDEIWSIEPGASVLDAITLMAEKGIGALLVMHGDELSGIVSERDYARKVILQGRSSNRTEVREIMTDKVFSTEPGDTIDDCMSLMTDKRIRHLPIMDEGKVVGVLSIGDLVKAKIEEQQFHIEQLENYINA